MIHLDRGYGIQTRGIHKIQWILVSTIWKHSHGSFSAKNKRILIPFFVRQVASWGTGWPDWAIYCTFGIFSKPVATIILPKSPTFLGNFCKGVKIFHFSSEIIFRQLLKTFGNLLLVTLLRSQLAKVLISSRLKTPHEAEHNN